MTTIWQRLLCKSDDLVPELKRVFEADGYKAYDPFPGGLGSPVGKLTRLRTFISPPVDNWHIVGTSDEIPASLLVELNLELLDIRLLEDDDYQIAVYHPDNAPDARLGALEPYLKDGVSLQDLAQIATLEMKADNADSLPSEISDLAAAQGVSAKHVDKMMGKMSKRIFRKMSADDTQKEQAMAMLQPTGINWNSAGAQKLQAIMDKLAIPEDWHLPEWKSLVAAYQIARQQQRGADLLAGDADTLAKVPNAIEYTPIYYAKKLS